MHTYLQCTHSCTGPSKSKLELGSPVWVVVEHVETVQQHIAGPQDLKATDHNAVDPTATIKCISTSVSGCVTVCFACKCRQVALLQHRTTACANHSAGCAPHASAAKHQHFWVGPQRVLSHWRTQSSRGGGSRIGNSHEAAMPQGVHHPDIAIKSQRQHVKDG